MKLLTGLLLGTLAQVIVWFQLNGQFKWEFFREHRILISVLCSIPISLLFVYSTEYLYHSLEGKVWAVRMASFATSIKEEVEASVQEKIEAVAKGFEVQNAELHQKLETAELALSEQTEKVEAFAAAGAVKKSVDPEDAEEEEGEALVKSAPASFWKNTYLPQELINSLGYRS